MKKFISALLFCVMLLILVSCGDNKNEPNNDTTKQPQTTQEQDFSTIAVSEILNQVLKNVNVSEDLGTPSIIDLNIENQQDYLGLSVNKYSQKIDSAAVVTWNNSSVSISLARIKESETIATITQGEINKGLSTYYNGFGFEGSLKGVSIQCGKDCFIFMGKKDLANVFIDAYKKTIKDYSVESYLNMYDPIVFFPEE